MVNANMRRNDRVKTLYNTWKQMLARCYDPTHRSYAIYGGKGVRVCKRWRDSVYAFCHDMGERPTPKHTLDRLDNAGNYEPGNVKWSTRREQALNRSSTVWVTWRGETLCLSDWERKLGVAGSTLLRCYRVTGSFDRVMKKGRLKTARLTSKYVGVTTTPTKKGWMAHVVDADNKTIAAGLYQSEELAARVYDHIMYRMWPKRLFNFTKAELRKMPPLSSMLKGKKIPARYADNYPARIQRGEFDKV